MKIHKKYFTWVYKATPNRPYFVKVACWYEGAW